jgi:hypothetical protein
MKYFGKDGGELMCIHMFIAPIHQSIDRNRSSLTSAIHSKWKNKVNQYPYNDVNSIRKLTNVKAMHTLDSGLWGCGLPHAATCHQQGGGVKYHWVHEQACSR